MYKVAFELKPGSLTPNHEAVPEANIVDRVRLFVEQIAPKASGAYEDPAPHELDAMRECARLLMSGAPLQVVESHANGLDYTVRPFYDHVMDRRLLILQKRADSDARGWGMFVFSPDADFDIIVEAPHPVFDRYSAALAAQGFQAADARALFVAGAHRHAVVEVRPGQEAFYPSDVAHNADSMFHAVHLQALDTLIPAAVVQFHGYARDEPEHNVIVSSGLEKHELAKRPDVEAFIQRIKEELIAETAQKKLDDGRPFRPNAGWVSGFMGTENVQGRATRAKGIPFLHVETGPEIRIREKNWNVRSTSRLALTVMDVVRRQYVATMRPLERPATFGFDRNEYPGRTPFTEDHLGYDGLMASWIHSAPFSFVGYHLESARYEARRIPREQRWTGHRRKLQMLGWQVEPLYIGREYLPSSQNDLSDEDGKGGPQDAENAMALASAEGFGRGTVVYLDVENTYEQQPNLTRYVKEWLQTFSGNSQGFTPGIYCSHLWVDAIVRFAPLNTVYWVFDVACGADGPSPGCRVGLQPQAFPTQGGLRRAEIWQYAKSPHEFKNGGDARSCGGGADLGEGYSTAVPATIDAADRSNQSEGECWTHTYGSHIAWTAEVDLNVRRAWSPYRPVVFRPVWTLIWLELRLPHTDYPNNILLRVSLFTRPVITIGPSPWPEPPRALRSIIDAVVLVGSALFAALSRQPESRPATRLLLTLARARAANAFRGGRHMEQRPGALL